MDVAANLLPSEDEATEVQLLVGALVNVHVTPKLVEM
jgi:hypothetical protein